MNMCYNIIKKHIRVLRKERDLMNEIKKLIILVLVILYFISPDPVSGPIDDAIVAVIGWAYRKSLTDKSNQT